MESTTFNDENSIESKAQSIGSQSIAESIGSLSTTSSSRKNNKQNMELDVDVESDVECNLRDDSQNWWGESVTKYALVSFLFLKYGNWTRKLY